MTSRIARNKFPNYIVSTPIDEVKIYKVQKDVDIDVRIDESCSVTTTKASTLAN